MSMIESGSEINEAKQLFPGYQENTDLFFSMYSPSLNCSLIAIQ